MPTLPVGGLMARIAEDAADLVVRNAEIHTGDPRLPQAEASTIRDGVVTAVGDDRNVAGQRRSWSGPWLWPPPGRLP